MKIDKKELENHFEQLSDAEIMRRVESGSLIDIALDVAVAELQRRGLSPVKPTESAPVEEGLLDAAEGRDMVELARMLTPTEAHILQARLVEEGIPAVVADAHLAQANYLWALAVGGARVLVPESFLGAAYEIKAAVARGDYSLEEDANVPE